MYKKRKNHTVPKIICSILLIYLVFLIFENAPSILNSKIGSSESTTEYSNTEDNNEVTPQVEDTTINLVAIGDIMCHSPNYKDAYDSSTGTYDFSTFFTQISSYISEADIAIGNLETTFAGGTKAYSGYPTFNSPSELAKNVQDMGIDILTTANNHSLDTGYSGLVHTIDVLDELGISHTGTFRSEEEQNEILIKDVNGIKIAFLSYTYGTNGISVPSGKDYCINLIDEDLIKSQLETAKSLEPDVICVSMHWGVEYQTTQNSEQEELADFLFENGADIILGSHPHVLEPMEKRTITLEDGTTKDEFVIYSLGNFMSAQKDKYTKDSIILNLQITKHSDGSITIDSYDYTPIYMQDNGTSATNRYQIIDLQKQITAYENGDTTISQSLYNTYVAELTNIKTVLKEDEE